MHGTPGEGSMRIRHLFTGDDGQSHFGHLDLPDGFGPAAALPATTVAFAELEPGRSHDYVTSAERHLVINLVGSAELQVGSGETWTFGPGDVLFAEDTTGQGHRSRSLEGHRSIVLVAVADSFDPTPWRVT
jgi:quercetin dioxygenase-like cupin family protein